MSMMPWLEISMVTKTATLDSMWHLEASYLNYTYEGISGDNWINIFQVLWEFSYITYLKNKEIKNES
jgi:hypothetical protein